jgi:hypothetical protein
MVMNLKGFGSDHSLVEVLSLIFPARAEENCEKLQSG